MRHKQCSGPYALWSFLMLSEIVATRLIDPVCSTPLAGPLFILARHRNTYVSSILNRIFQSKEYLIKSFPVFITIFITILPPLLTDFE